MEVIYSFKMFNEILLFNRSLEEPLDHIKFLADRYSCSNDIREMVFENMKRGDWVEVLGLNYNDLMLMPKDEVMFLAKKLEELKQFKQRKEDPAIKKIEDQLSKMGGSNG